MPTHLFFRCNAILEKLVKRDQEFLYLISIYAGYLILTIILPSFSNSSGLKPTLGNNSVYLVLAII